MKTSHLVTLATLALTTATVLAQGGPLTPPPGAPAPTMKSLDQIEPRIPLVAGAPGVDIGAFGTITISQPGSYYLTKNLQITGNSYGIIINASGVTLDLMGHSIIAPASGNALDGILVQQNFTNIHIQNGHILSSTTFVGSSFTPSGFEWGIFAWATTSNVHVSHVAIRGIRIDGIKLIGQGCTVEKCSVFIAGQIGIENSNGTVNNSIVHTTNTGIIAPVVSNCRVNNSLGLGIDATTVSNSFAQSISTAFDGINATTVENSVGITSGAHGISATTVTNSRGRSTNTSSDRQGISAVGGQVPGSVGLAAGGHGIAAPVVSNSRGQSTNTSSGQHGIFAPAGQVSGSVGITAGGHGISATSVSHSIGTSTGANSTNSSGITANRVSSSQGNATSASGGLGISGIFSITASYGISSRFQGILSSDGTVSDSYGISTGDQVTSRGIEAQIVTNSRGRSTNTSGREGVRALTLAMNSIGESSGASGLFASRAATNCYGFTNHTADSSHGISSNGSVSSSYGWSNGTGGGDGINALTVIGSFGFAAAGARHGISSTIVESSIGNRSSAVAGKFGIQANRASLSQSNNGESIPNRYNMP